MLQRVIKSVYSHFSYDVTTYVADVVQNTACTASNVWDTMSPGHANSSDSQVTPPCTENEIASDSGASNVQKEEIAHMSAIVSQTTSRDVSLGNQIATPACAKVLLAKDGVPLVGLKEYPVGRAHPPVQYTKFTVVSASSIARPRRRLARIRIDKAPIRRTALRVQPQLLPPQKSDVAPPLTPATPSAPRSAPMRSCVSGQPSTSTSSPAPTLPSPSVPPPVSGAIQPPPGHLSDTSGAEQHSNETVSKAVTQSKPLLIKDTSRYTDTGLLFGRMDFTLLPKGTGAGRLQGPVTKGAAEQKAGQRAGQRTNKLHFHMVTMVNKAKRTALSSKNRELHRLLATTTGTSAEVSEGVGDVETSKGLTSSRNSSMQGCPGPVDYSLQAHLRVNNVSPLNTKGTSDEERSETSTGVGTSEKEAVRHHMVTTSQDGRPRRKGRQPSWKSMDSNGRDGGGVSSSSKKMLTFHVYEDPASAFKVKRSRQN